MPNAIYENGDGGVEVDPTLASGLRGYHGWSMVTALVADGERRVRRLVDWTGGEGIKPDVGGYIGPLGLVVDIADATDDRGTKGEDGEGLPGAPGAPGEDGADGKSLYQVAVDNGFVGTEVEWLNYYVNEIAEAATAEAIDARDIAQASAVISTDNATQTAADVDASNAALADAEAAKVVVEGLASAFIIAENTFATKGTAEEWSPIAAPDYIRTAGALAPADGGGTTYMKGTGPGGFTLNLSGGGTQDYKPGDMRGVDIRVFGAGPTKTATENSARIALAMTMASEIWFPHLPAGEHININETIVVPDHVKVRGSGWASRVRQTVREKNIFEAGNFCSFEGLHLIGDGGITGVAFEKINGIYASGKTGVLVQSCFGEKFEGCPVHLRGCKDYKILNNTFFANHWGAIASSADIVVYSGVVAGERGQIIGNSCLSNNSQGIFVDALGHDADVIVSNNNVVTLDPLTCVEAGTWVEAPTVGVAPSIVRRRHGIVVGYQASSVGGPRALVTGNICRNTKWTGIYKQGGGEGGALIVGNFCSLNGWELGNSLSGGIYVTTSGNDIVSGNLIRDFQNTGSASGGITINATVAPTTPTKVHGNTILNSMGKGIAVGTNSAYVDIEDNTVVGSSGMDIDIVNNSNATTGGHKISGNKIKRTSGNSVPSIRVATGTTTNITTVDGNYIEGFDRANVSNQNAGITTTTPMVVRVRGNHIKNFNVAFSSTAYYAAASRLFDVVLADNFIDDCTTGFGVAGNNNTTVVPIVGNRFTNVTNKTAASIGYAAGGIKCGYICRKDNDRLVVLELAAAPTVGTWAVGDRVEFTVAPANGARDAICMVAGNPGTWDTPISISILTADAAKLDIDTAQNVFAAAQDELTVAALTTYEFEAQYVISRAAGAVSRTLSVLFGGTATFTSIDYTAETSSAIGNVLAPKSEIVGNAATALTVTAPSIETTENIRVRLRGTLRVNAGGTIIPQFQFSAEAGGVPTVKRNSFFRARPIGLNTMLSQGSWS
ncbi:hypothetical protein EOC93_02350 [Mesorhizobium sp. M6A.T.Ce.TU.002.03.1.1]|uniref:right-handed parallel beta-helix repeat-containing protein n=1 Tax=Mesorhizobium sp. M6A.T.Ce.TU.002.03.1.1 TaxID=2496782 RepID=UPI000FCBA943|nr:right-handed parallel beta-helix repeat-containing protein [Mesorhizobium sp. M6A.T.Ce.TU.002.03.1.1]RUU46634.1 hypothetical protein EOC93_02350 [Mesorhizobium sp. M6A.T.Ce.TU.002.03.1.1]